MESILVVEDDADVRYELAFQLNEFGYKAIILADCGGQALEVIQSRPFVTIVSDIKMPGMDGFELYTLARSHGITVPFVFVSGYAEHFPKIQAAELGLYDFILKPWSPDRLYKSIKLLSELYKKDSEMRHLSRLGNFDPKEMTQLEGEMKQGLNELRNLAEDKLETQAKDKKVG